MATPSKIINLLDIKPEKLSIETKIILIII